MSVQPLRDFIVVTKEEGPKQTAGCCCEEHKDLYAYSNSKLTKFISNILKPYL